MLPELEPRPQPQWKGDFTSSVNCQLRRETTENNLFLSFFQMHTFYALFKKMCILHIAELYRIVVQTCGASLELFPLLTSDLFVGLFHT